MIFCKNKFRHQFDFILQGQALEIVDTYLYLGVIFKYNGTFLETKKKLVEQAEKALYCVYKLVRKETLPVDIQLLLFDSMIEPILIYCSEVWGYENLKFIGQIHLKFVKEYFKLEKSLLILRIWENIEYFLLSLYLNSGRNRFGAK